MYRWILHENNVLTWFLPLSTSTLVTFPNGMPRCMTSASVTSLGMLRMCITRDGLLLAVLSSLTWNFFHIIKTHRSAKRAVRRTMGSRTSRQPHAPTLAISWTANKRPGEFNLAGKGRGAGRDGRTGWGQLSSYYLPHFSRIE